MTNPLTPPPELVGEWLRSDDFLAGPLEQACHTITTNRLNNVANQAAQWGADQELKACCNWLPKLPPWSADDLRKHRRPKPPSLKEQAYDALDTYIYGEPDPKDKERTYNTIRRALEQL